LSDELRTVTSNLARMLELANSLVDHPDPEPALRELHAQAVTLQLLCASLQTAAGQADRRLQEARRYLENHLAPVPTISQVARAVGISQTLLKQRFKSQFGETIYQFSVRCRMERAFQLLQRDCLPIAKTASTVGYNASTAFATAFRRQFGMSPRDVRKHVR
jgi:AraC-like DNA-binding protein